MRIFVFILLLCSVHFVNAQDQQNAKKEKIESMKIAFLSEKMNLSAKEAQLFWPLYNEYNHKQDQLKKSQKMQLGDQKLKVENLSDKDAKKLLDEMFELKQKEIDLQKEYYLKYMKVISLSKIALLYQAETEFKRELLKKIKEN